MRETTVYFDLADTSDPVFDRPIEILLIGVLAFGPLAMGATQAPPNAFASTIAGAWTETVFIAIALVMAGVLALKLLFRPDVQFIRSWTYWPIALFVALVAFQLAPLPAGLIKFISPATHWIKTELLSDLPHANEDLRWMTLTFYREATLHDLRLLIALICIYVVVINCIRRVSQIRRLLLAIAIIAGVFAIVSLAQVAIGTTDIYGLIPMPTRQVARSGPFVNHSHFGQFMNLSVGAAIGLALVLINQHFRRDDYSPGEIARKLKSEGMRPAWVMLGVVVLSMGAVLLSLSRGATLGAAIAGFVVGAVLVTRPGAHGRFWIILAILLCVTVVVLLDFNSVARRVFESGERADITSGRMEIVRGLWHAWKEDFPFLGSGLGTFSVIFPGYDRSSMPLFATHAENEYMQLLTETGAIGALFIATFLILVVSSMVRAVRGAMSPASSATMGLMFGLIAVLVHSFTDFGQHIPAVAALTTVTCALIINLGQLRWRELDRVSSTLPARGSLIARIGGLVAIVGVGVWIGIASISTIRADHAWRVVKRMDAYLQGRRWQAEDAQYADIITAAQTAADARPGNVFYQYYLNLYRWKSITRELQPDGRPTSDAIQYFPRIIDELHAARRLCPTYGPIYLLAAQLEAQLPDRTEQAATDLRRAFLLSGPDPVVAFLTGQLDAREGNMDQAMVRLRRAAELDRGLIPDVIGVCINQIRRPDLALQLAADDLDALNILARELGKDPATKSLADQARDRAFAALEAKAQQTDATPEMRAQLAHALIERERYEEAIAQLRRALSFDYGQTDWRMQLANTLAKLGRNDEAIHEAEICLRRREMRDARELIARLSQQPPSPPTTTTTPSR